MADLHESGRIPGYFENKCIERWIQLDYITKSVDTFVQSLLKIWENKDKFHEFESMLQNIEYISETCHIRYNYLYFYLRVKKDLNYEQARLIIKKIHDQLEMHDIKRYDYCFKF